MEHSFSSPLDKEHRLAHLGPDAPADTPPPPDANVEEGGEPKTEIVKSPEDAMTAAKERQEGTANTAKETAQPYEETLEQDAELGAEDLDALYTQEIQRSIAAPTITVKADGVGEAVGALTGVQASPDVIVTPPAKPKAKEQPDPRKVMEAQMSKISDFLSLGDEGQAKQLVESLNDDFKQNVGNDPELNNEGSGMIEGINQDLAKDPDSKFRISFDEGTNEFKVVDAPKPEPKTEGKEQPADSAEPSHEELKKQVTAQVDEIKTALDSNDTDAANKLIAELNPTFEKYKAGSKAGEMISGLGMAVAVNQELAKNPNAKSYLAFRDGQFAVMDAPGNRPPKPDEQTAEPRIKSKAEITRGDIVQRVANNPELRALVEQLSAKMPTSKEWPANDINEVNRAIRTAMLAEGITPDQMKNIEPKSRTATINFIKAVLSTPIEEAKAPTETTLQTPGKKPPEGTPTEPGQSPEQMKPGVNAAAEQAAEKAPKHSSKFQELWGKYQEALAKMKDSTSTSKEKMQAASDAVMYLFQCLQEALSPTPDGAKGAPTGPEGGTTTERQPTKPRETTDRTPEKNEDGSTAERRERLTKELKESKAPDIAGLKTEKTEKADKEKEGIDQQLKEIGAEKETASKEQSGLKEEKTKAEVELASEKDPVKKAQLERKRDALQDKIDGLQKTIDRLTKQEDQLKEQKSQIDKKLKDDLDQLDQMQKAFDAIVKTVRDSYDEAKQLKGDSPIEKFLRGVTIVEDPKNLTISKKLDASAREAAKTLQLNEEHMQGIPVLAPGFRELLENTSRAIHDLVEAQRKLDAEKSKDNPPSKDAPEGQIRQDRERNYWQKGADHMWHSHNDQAKGMTSDAGFKGVAWGDSLMDERTLRIVATEKPAEKFAPAKDAPTGEIRQDKEGNHWVKNEDRMWHSYHDPSKSMTSDAGFKDVAWGDALIDERTTRIVGKQESGTKPEEPKEEEPAKPADTESPVTEKPSKPAEKPEESVEQKIDGLKQDLQKALDEMTAANPNESMEVKAVLEKLNAVNGDGSTWTPEQLNETKLDATSHKMPDGSTWELSYDANGEGLSFKQVEEKEEPKKKEEPAEEPEKPATTATEQEENLQDTTDWKEVSRVANEIRTKITEGKAGAMPTKEEMNNLAGDLTTAYGGLAGKKEFNQQAEDFAEEMNDQLKAKNAGYTIGYKGENAFSVD